MNKGKELQMSFDPKTIEHLGIKMYSRLSNALAELIANAFDACASEVFVHLIDNKNEKKIIVEDNGHGMNFDEINEKFLVIGRNRRKEGEFDTPCGRKVTGKKGLGKLSLFGIGKTIIISTCKEGTKTIFTLNWDEMINTPAGEPYKPKFDIMECGENEHGTKIEVLDLKKNYNFDPEFLSKRIAALFNFPDDFIVFIQRNDDEIIEITNKLKFEDINEEFKWELPEWLEEKGLTDYEHYKKIKGRIITANKPLKPELRGITLFANGRMVNSPEFFGNSESSHFFSYTTGWLNIDFVDNWEEDVISTNRQALDWEHPATKELRKYLAKILSEIHKEWRIKRKEKKTEKVEEKANVNIKDWIEKLPEPVQRKVKPIVDTIISDPDLNEEESGQIISQIHGLAPEFTFLHYRHLHPEIADAAFPHYQHGFYYTAVIEAIKRYVDKVRQKAGLNNEMDHEAVSKAFGKEKNKPLSVSKKYKKRDGTNFHPKTYENIEEAQKFLSMGVVAGARNPISHEEIKELKKSGLFTEKDALDMLSIISHLMRRLDDAEPNESR